MPVTAVILEGIRRVDEWKRIRKVFPSANLTFRAVDAGYKPRDPARARARWTWRPPARRWPRSASSCAARSSTRPACCSTCTARGWSRSIACWRSAPASDPVGTIQDLLAIADERLQARRYDAALEAYEEVLALDRLNQNAKKGLIAVTEARDRERALRTVPLDKVPVLRMDMADLTRENIDPQEGFVLSRVNGQWDVRSILKLCPMAEEDALLIFARLLSRGVIELTDKR